MRKLIVGLIGVGYLYVVEKELMKKLLFVALILSSGGELTFEIKIPGCLLHGEAKKKETTIDRETCWQ
jgi:hypothetical protein